MGLDEPYVPICIPGNKSSDRLFMYLPLYCNTADGCRRPISREASDYYRTTAMTAFYNIKYTPLTHMPPIKYIQ